MPNWGVSSMVDNKVKTGLQITEPVVVARTADDRRQIVAQRADVVAGNFNGPAQVRSFTDGVKASYGKVQGLQSILKFAIGWELLEQDEVLAGAKNG